MNYLEIIGILFISTIRKTLLLTHRYPLLCTALAWLTFFFKKKRKVNHAKAAIESLCMAFLLVSCPVKDYSV